MYIKAEIQPDEKINKIQHTRALNKS